MSNKKQVAIVVARHEINLNQKQEISLKHLYHYLDKYDKYLVIPAGSQIEQVGFSAKKFHPKYFKSIAAYSKLLMSKEFYLSFDEYEYILIYHLDSLVFSDRLTDWCEKGYDYIGAPWFKNIVYRIKSLKIPQDCVGNGGFSLRKISTFIKVLEIYQKPLQWIARLCTFYGHPYRFYGKFLDLAHFKQHRLPGLKNIPLTIYQYIAPDDFYFRRNEDQFWSFEAKKLFPDFKIAPVEIALSFAFEFEPGFCYAKNNHSLPFGCHKWGNYEEYLL